MRGETEQQKLKSDETDEVGNLALPNANDLNDSNVRTTRTSVSYASVSTPA